MRRHLLLLFCVFGCFAYASAAESQLAIINGAISTSEDGPPVASDYRFSPGDYVYVSFEIAGFAVHTENQGEVRKISLQYEVTPEDHEGRALTEPASGDIATTLSPEDKNWVPKRRATFLLPSFLAAGKFHVHIGAKDVFGKTEAARDVDFLIGGVKLAPADSITIQNFRFLRRENDAEPLTLAAYSAGDTVYARFEMSGFEIGADHRCRLAFGVTVLDPSGKAFIQNPDAAKIEQDGFYPPQFVPGELALQMGKKNEPGAYTVIVEARDLIANQKYELKQTFSIE